MAKRNDRFYRRNRSGRRSRRMSIRRRRGGRYIGTQYIPRIPRATLLGNTKTVKLKYHEAITLSPGPAGGPATEVFLANGMFDPHVGAGHQPRGFDELMTLYKAYTVVLSKLTATFYPNGPDPLNTESTGGTLAVALRDTAVLFPSQNDIFEDRNISFRGMPTFRSSAAVVVSKTFNAARFLGVPTPTSTFTLRGSEGTNPQALAFFHVSYVPVIPIDAPHGIVDVMIDMEFTAVLTEPKLPAISIV